MSYINDYKSDEDENNQGNCSYNITIINRLTIHGYHSVGIEFLGMPLTLIGKSWKTHPEIFPKFQFFGA